MTCISTFIDPLARVLMAALFLLSGIGKLGAVAATQGYMSAFGVPSFFFWPTAAFEIATGALLVLGLGVRPVAILARFKAEV